MRTHQLIQGTPEWMAHRSSYWNASDAPAMMGCSKYKTRSQLLAEAATGIGADVTPGQQRLYDAGHNSEALCRPHAEVVVGDDLYPVVGTDDSDRFSASFDGLTMDETTAFEHKMLNAELRALMVDGCTGADLPLMYRVQMEQQCLVAESCERVLFMASRWEGETLVEERHCWYTPDPELRAQIVAGWTQFEADVATYAPAAVSEVIEVVGHRPNQLPALRSSVRGELVLESNIVEWETAALAYIKSVRDHELNTDEDFANAAEAAEWCETSKTSLQGVRANLMGATGDVNTAVATLDRIMSELDKTRTAFTNAIKARKEARKAEMVLGKQAKLREYLDSLTKRTGMTINAAADFAGVLKNLKSFASMEDKLETELARAKIAATGTADLIDTNRKAMDAADAAHLFPDFSSVCQKPADDFANLISSRRATAQARADKERKDREDQEAKDKADAEAKVEADRLAELNTPQQGTQQVLKAEPATADATDRVAPAHASPVGGPMGVGQPAAAGPAGGYAPAPEVRAFTRTAAPAVPEQPTLTLGEIKARIVPLSIDAAGLEALGFPATRVRAACMYRESDWPDIHAAMEKALASSRPQRKAA